MFVNVYIGYFHCGENTTCKPLDKKGFAPETKLHWKTTNDK